MVTISNSNGAFQLHITIMQLHLSIISRSFHLLELTLAGHIYIHNFMHWPGYSGANDQLRRTIAEDRTKPKIPK